MTSDHLIGWLVFLRLQLSRGATVHLTEDVRIGLGRKGWIVYSAGEDERGERDISLTQKGVDCSDLHAADWGVDAIPEAA